MAAVVQEGHFGSETHGGAQVTHDKSQTTADSSDWRQVARAREMGAIQHALYVALGAAALIGDEELIEQLKPIVWRYRAKTKDDLEGTPYV